jgi:hypothetical protein
MTKKNISILALMLSFVFPFLSIIVLKILSNMSFFYVHDIKVMVEEIGLPIRKLPKNISFYPIACQSKIRKILLTRLKIKHNVNILHQRSFYSFWTCDPLVRTTGCSKKKMLYSHLLIWIPCYFPYNMGMLVFYMCSNQKPFHKLEKHW